MHQSRGLKNKAKLWESLKGQGGGNLGETFTSCWEDEELYILWIEHYWKLMLHLVMLDFQLMIMTFPIESTSATQASKAWEGGEELEIDFCRSITNVGIKT